MKLLGLDRRKRGTHYQDRVGRILRACQDVGILDHKMPYGIVHDVEPVGEVSVTPQYERYGFRVSPRVLDRFVAMGTKFAMVLNVPQATVEVDGDTVFVLVPLDRVASVTFEQTLAQDSCFVDGEVLLGQDADGAQVTLLLASAKTVHAAVIGATGSGKSTLMRTMALSALHGGTSVALFDPTGGFRTISGHPLVWRGGQYQSAADCELGLECLVRSMERNSAGPRSRSAQKSPRTLLIFVDEVPDLVLQCPPIREHLARLAQAGRHAGYHLILGAQHPLASDLGSTTLRNLPTRLVGRVTDRIASYNATGRNDVRAERFRGSGDFVLVCGETVKRFQAALVGDETLRQFAKRYPPREARLPLRAHTHVAQESLISERAAGRPTDDIPPEIAQLISCYVNKHGVEPSLNWVYKQTKQLSPTGGFGREKAKRAIEASRSYVK